MSNLQITEQTKRVTILTFNDRLDAFSAPDAREHIEHPMSEGADNFVVDLAEVSFMDSAGVAVLVNLLKRTKQVGGDVKLVRPSSKTAFRILHLTKFDQVFDMFDTAQAAVASF
jgi:anti-sigma B factor antagonist